MEARKVGGSGLAVSVLGLGCNNFGMRIGPDETQSVVDAALDAGITFFDTAEMYGGGKSEEFLGAALGKSANREDVIIASKFGRPDDGGSRTEIIRACERSLRRLNTDYLDLYYQHYVDRTTPIEETLSALTHLVAQGKVRYLGSSNVASWHIAEADHTGQVLARYRNDEGIGAGGDQQLVVADRVPAAGGDGLRLAIDPHHGIAGDQVDGIAVVPVAPVDHDLFKGLLARQQR